MKINQNSKNFELMMDITTNTYLTILSQMDKNNTNTVNLAKELHTQLENVFDATETDLTNEQIEKYFELQKKIEEFSPENEPTLLIHQNSIEFEIMMAITTNSYLTTLSKEDKNNTNTVSLAKELYTQLEDAFDAAETDLTNDQIARYFDLQAKIEKYLPENEKEM